MNARAKKAKHDEPHVTPAAYQVAVDAAQLRNIRLIRSDFDVQPEGFSTNRDRWKHSYSCVVTRSFYDPDRGLLTGLVTGAVACRAGRKKIISLKCDYLVAFDVHGEPDEAAALKFIERLGNFAAYPYFRAHFSEVTSQAGIALPPLPIMKESPRRVSSPRMATTAEEP